MQIAAATKKKKILGSTYFLSQVFWPDQTNFYYKQLHPHLYGEICWLNVVPLVGIKSSEVRLRIRLFCFRILSSSRSRDGSSHDSRSLFSRRLNSCPAEVTVLRSFRLSRSEQRNTRSCTSSRVRDACTFNSLRWNSKFVCIYNTCITLMQ